MTSTATASLPRPLCNAPPVSLAIPRADSTFCSGLHRWKAAAGEELLRTIVTAAAFAIFGVAVRRRRSTRPRRAPHSPPLSSIAPSPACSGQFLATPARVRSSSPPFASTLCSNTSWAAGSEGAPGPRAADRRTSPRSPHVPTARDPLQDPRGTAGEGGQAQPSRRLDVVQKDHSTPSSHHQALL